MRQRWPDDVSTELLPVRESREHVDDRRARPPLWLVKVLLIAAAVAAIAASVVVAIQMTNRSPVSTPVSGAVRGDCLTWPPGEPEQAKQVDCAAEHVFEVVDSQASNSASEAERQQTCTQAVTRDLGPRYDPGGRFVVGTVETSGRLMCGLQLPSNGVASLGFKGRVVDQDQSRVWPTGTCLGIRDGQTTDVPIDCGLPHALEITGTADLSTKFGQAAPSVSAQDAVVLDACNAATSTYLAPVALEATGLAVRYQPIDAAGWAAGSRRIACRIGSPEPNGRWATLVRSAKDGVIVDGQHVASPPSPAEPDVPPPAESPADVAAPTEEESEPTTDAEVPVRVSRDTDDSTSEAEAVPHLAGSEAPGPVLHGVGTEAPGPVPHLIATGELPGPAPATAAPPPESGSP